MKRILLLIFLCVLTLALQAQDNSLRPELSKKEVRQYQRKLKKLNRSLQKKTTRLRRFLEEQGIKVPDLNASLPGDSLLISDLSMPDSSIGNIGVYRGKLKEKVSIPDSLQDKLRGLQRNLPTPDSLVAPDRNSLIQFAKGKLNVSTDTSGLASRLGNKRAQFDRLRGNKPGFDQLTQLSPMAEEVNLLKKKLKLGSDLTQGDAKTKAKLQASVLELADIEYDLKDLEKLKSQVSNLRLDSATLKQYIDPLNADLSDIRSQVGGYQSQLEGYKKELIDWDKTLEREIMKMEEVRGIAEYAQKQVANPASGILDAEKTIEKGYQSKDFINKLLEERFEKLLKEEGADALSKRLAEGHEKMQEYKKKFESLQDITKAPRRPPNPLKGVSLKERLVFGGNFQINRQRPITLDAGLEVAYRLTLKSEWGLGGAYRLKLGKGKKPETVTDMLNFRSFYHHKFWKSLGLQANYELNYAIPRTIQVVENPVKQWQESALIGIRNEQPFSKKLGGYVTLQYDLLYKAGSPSSKWLFRFAFRLK